VGLLANNHMERYGIVRALPSLCVYRRIGRVQFTHRFLPSDNPAPHAGRWSDKQATAQQPTKRAL
jgi:hypothetical protein